MTKVGDCQPTDHDDGFYRITNTDVVIVFIIILLLLLSLLFCLFICF